MNKAELVTALAAESDYQRRIRRRLFQLSST